MVIIINKTLLLLQILLDVVLTETGNNTRKYTSVYFYIMDDILYQLPIVNVKY